LIHLTPSFNSFFQGMLSKDLAMYGSQKEFRVGQPGELQAALDRAIGFSSWAKLGCCDWDCKDDGEDDDEDAA
jgi:hypothetical protein